jgi:hypothetical protein
MMICLELKKIKEEGKKWLEGQSRQLFTTSSSAEECNSRRPCVYLYTLSSLKGVLYRSRQREKESEREISIKESRPIIIQNCHFYESSPSRD